MPRDQAWVGRKDCGCATFASIHPRVRPPSNGRMVRGRWRDTDGELTMRRVPVDQAIVTVCRCGL